MIVERRSRAATFGDRHRIYSDSARGAIAEARRSHSFAPARVASPRIVGNRGECGVAVIQAVCFAVGAFRIKLFGPACPGQGGPMNSVNWR